MSGLRLDADLLAIRAIGPWLRTVLAPHVADDGLDAVVSRCELALQEVAANVVRHGYGEHDPGMTPTIDLTAEVDGDAFRVVVADRGAPYDPDAQPEPDPHEPQVHGYGLVIVRRLTRRFDHTRSGDTNRTVLEFELPDAPSTAEEGPTAPDPPVDSTAPDPLVDPTAPDPPLDPTAPGPDPAHDTGTTP